MKNSLFGKIISIIAMTAAICCSQTPFASADANDSLTTEMSLMTGTTVSLGEPIILRSRVVNIGGQALAVHLGSYIAEWYSLSLTDAEGQPVPKIPGTRLSEPHGLQANADRPVLPGENITAYIVVTRDFILPHPGQYQLTVHVHMPYGQVFPGDRAPRVWKKAITDASTVLTQDFSYSLSVTPTDVKKISKTSVQLRQQIGAHPYGDLSDALATALFSMPEAVAAASWRVLTDKPGMASEMY